MKRNKHSLSHYRLTTLNMGELVPIACYDVLPGDTVQQATSALIRLSPLATPVMHPVVVRIHHWFVPYRLLWDDFENFITGGSDGEGDGAVFPYIASGGGGFTAGALADYFGIKPGEANLQVSALPFRAYNKIFNEFYRDQDLVTDRVLSTLGGADVTTAVTLATIGWEKDYFTTARPWEQKGPDITLPLGTTAPVIRRDPYTADMQIRLASGALSGASSLAVDASGAFERGDGTNVLLDPNGQLLADLSNATAVSVNAVREAFALQRYQEARAMYGSRYTEYLRYLGVRSSDARLQRPEYLGGGKQTIAFSEVLQTAPDSSDEGVASLFGHGISAMRSRRYRRFFEEHGCVLSLMSVRPRTMYTEALDRMWSKRTKEEYWQSELERIGQQEVYSREVWAEADGTGGSDVFGYQDRYAEYRHIQNAVTGQFRTTYNDWHLSRTFAAAPVLNSSFVTCDPAVRIFQDQTVGADHLLVMASHSIQARRPVARAGQIPRII